MSKNENQKFKSLMVARILEQLTDEDHPMTPKKIQDWMDSHGISGEQKSILRDINQLIDFYNTDIVDDKYGNIFNYDYEIKHDDSYYNRGYKIVGRPFDYEEIQLLLECIDNAKFVSEKKATTLKKKLASLRSVYEKENLLDIRTTATGRYKASERNVINIMSDINGAIKRNHKIKFFYDKYIIQNNKIVKTNSTDSAIIVSPFKLVMNDSYYYLLCCQEKDENEKVNPNEPRHMMTQKEATELFEPLFEKGLNKKMLNMFEKDYVEIPYTDEELSNEKVVIYRLDRINRIYELEIKRSGSDIFKKIDVNRLANECFDLSGWDKYRTFITLKCSNHDIDRVIDRFGTDNIVFKKDDSNHFYVKTYIYPNVSFFCWVMSFLGSVIIVEPEDIVDRYDTVLRLVAGIPRQYYEKYSHSIKEETDIDEN